MDIKGNTYKPKEVDQGCIGCICGCFITLCVIMILLFSGKLEWRDDHEDLKVSVMNFRILESNETSSFTARWDLSIRVPPSLPGYYICLNGDFQAYLLYHNFPIVTPIKSYTNLLPRWSHQLKVSADVSKEDVNGALAKGILYDIKERGEVRFGVRLFLPDCRGKKMEMMEYVCDEAKLRHVSNPRSDEITTTVVGHPTCRYVRHH